MVSARLESNGFEDIGRKWFLYRYVTAEYAEKNAIKRPWGDILYKNLQPKSKSEAITQGFYPCMNKKAFGLDFNPGPSAPRADGTRDANPNVIGPFYNLEGLITHIAVQGADVDHSADDADSDEAPAPPKLQNVQSEDLSRIFKKTEKSKKNKKKPIKSSAREVTPAAVLRNEDATIDLSSDEDLGDDALELLIKSSIDDLQLPVDISVTFHGAIANELALAQKIVELKNKIDYEKAQFKKNMAKLSVADVQSFKRILHDLKEEFHKKREEAKGSREQMKYFAGKCVQAHNEAEKRKALGRPGSKPKVPSAASELKKMRTDEAEAKKRKHKNASNGAPSTKKPKTKSSRKERAATTEPLVVEPISVARPASTNQERQLVLHEPASTEAPEDEEIPTVDPIIAEDIGHSDNVVDDEVLPQIEHQLVSSHVLTNSKLISIGHPLTPITQDDSWSDRPQQDTPIDDETPRTPPPQATTPVLDDDNYMVQTTPSP
nr:nucleolar protein dao-5-like [Aegilops tauschii subsp. strangulata]